MSIAPNFMMVMLTGQADETQTCFHAAEAGYDGVSASSPGSPVKMSKGWEGVVYTKHPVKLDHLFGRGVMFAELEGPERTWYIYPPGEAVDVNKLISELPPLIKQEFPTASAIYHFTQRYGCYPDIPDCTFLKEFSSHLRADENHNGVIDKSSYRPGNVIDIVMNKEGRTLFTSIFIGVGIVKYRLAVLGEFIPDEEVKGKMNGGICKHKDDKVVEAGELQPEDDSVADAARIITWMKAGYRKSLMAQRLELFADYDSAEHFEAIAGILKAVGAWRNDRQSEVGNADGQSGGPDSALLVSSAYADTAHSHVAVGALAPFFEGMFIHEFQLLRKYYDGQLPINGHHRWKLKPEDFWNPHKQSENGVVKAGDGIQRGSRQLLEALDLLKRFPADLDEVTDALFTYRNRSLHMGYDWPLDRRSNFQKLLEERKWGGKWFSVVLSEKTVANSESVPLLFAMTEKLIERCVSLGKECVATFFDIKNEKLGNPDENLDPILKSLLSKKW